MSWRPLAAVVIPGPAATVAIALNHGQTVIVDEVDADLAAFRWKAEKKHTTFYAKRTARQTDGRRISETLHKVIAYRMGLVGMIDHRDRDGLNCRRENLRSATPSQSGANRGMQKNNTSGVKGVSWDKKAGKWWAYIRVNGKVRHLGRFTDLEAARAASDKAREEAFGPYACIGRTS